MPDLGGPIPVGHSLVGDTAGDPSHKWVDGMKRPPKSGENVSFIKLNILLLCLVWSLVLAGSLWWNLEQNRQVALAMAHIQAATAFEKDVLYRRWNARHGGVYASIDADTTPNPYLKAAEREIETPSGKKLTKINPAYMTRQVHELGATASGVTGHITSLRPLRPQNLPDPWEARALAAFDRGAREASSVQTVKDEPYFRFMRPLMTEAVCLPCHAVQGYQEGEVRGGISVSVPLKPILAAAETDTHALIATHAVIWLIGVLGLVLFGATLSRRVSERDRAMSEVKKLEGVLPVCAACKKIRDDQGRWHNMETYIRAHSSAGFTHGICPDCAKKLYPDLCQDDD